MNKDYLVTVIWDVFISYISHLQGTFGNLKMDSAVVTGWHDISIHFLKWYGPSVQVVAPMQPS